MMLVIIKDGGKKMNKKIVFLSVVTAVIILLTGFTPALASNKDNLIEIKNDLVTIEVNHYLGRQPKQVRTTVTASEAEEIRQYLIALYNAQERNDRQSISTYEALLNEKGIFGESYQKFYSNNDGLTLIEKTKLPRFPSSLAGENISNRFCYFNAIGEGLVFWGLALTFLLEIVNVIKNATNLITMLILLIVPFLLSDIFTKIIFASGLITIFVTLTWRYYFSDQEKIFFTKIFNRDYSFWNNRPL
jgi:hypothetical protein